MSAERLRAVYAGRRAYHGELHDHADTGGTSDGRATLAQWTAQLERKRMDFAAILDHRQVRHMYIDGWKDGLFIAGTEPGTEITDADAEVKQMHYNMLFPDRDELAKLLDEFPEYGFTGGTEGHFVYPAFTRERFGELIDAVMARGGFFVHPHPKQLMKSHDPCQYVFRDGMGIEVFYNDYNSEPTAENYALWTDILKAGKRVYACAGGDKHCDAGDGALTTIYLREKTSRGFMEQLRRGDFVCGSVGIRMCIGDTTMGGSCRFEGNMLDICVSDLHASVADPSHSYRADVITEAGVVCSFPVSCIGDTYFSTETACAGFYRVEVIDETTGFRIAIGNPIWND